MISERWEHVERLYHSAQERASDRRDAYLGEACDGDNELRREVESMLAQSNSSHGTFDRSALEFAVELLTASDRTPLIGKQLGS